MESLDRSRSVLHAVFGSRGVVVCLRLLLKPSGPLGHEKPFYMPHASLLLTRGDVNFSDRFQLGSFSGTSHQAFNLYFCCWRLEIETLTYMIQYNHMLISDEGDLVCEACRENWM